jgi:hypothetical protein
LFASRKAGRGKAIRKHGQRFCQRFDSLKLFKELTIDMIDKYRLYIVYFTKLILDSYEGSTRKPGIDACCPGAFLRCYPDFV